VVRSIVLLLSEGFAVPGTDASTPPHLTESVRRAPVVLAYCLLPYLAGVPVLAVTFGVGSLIGGRGA